MRPLVTGLTFLALVACSSGGDEDETTNAPATGGAHSTSSGGADVASGGSETLGSGGTDTSTGGSQSPASGGSSVSTGGAEVVTTGGETSLGGSSTGGRLMQPSFGGDGPASPCEEYCVKWHAYDCNRAVEESNVFTDEDHCMDECQMFPTPVEECRIDALDFVQVLSARTYCVRAAKEPESICRP